MVARSCEAYKKQTNSPGRPFGGQSVGRAPKGHASDPGKGTRLGCKFDRSPAPRGAREATSRGVSTSVSLSLSPFHCSLKRNGKNSLRCGLKKQQKRKDETLSLTICSVNTVLNDMVSVMFFRLVKMKAARPDPFQFPPVASDAPERPAQAGNSCALF